MTLNYLPKQLNKCINDKKNHSNFRAKPHYYNSHHHKILRWLWHRLCTNLPNFSLRLWVNVAHGIDNPQQPTHFLGFDTSFQPEQSNFRQVDTVPYTKEGRMEELIENEFGL